MTATNNQFEGTVKSTSMTGDKINIKQVRFSSSAVFLVFAFVIRNFCRVTFRDSPARTRLKCQRSHKACPSPAAIGANPDGKHLLSASTLILRRIVPMTLQHK
jgi:hypothetical protein